MQEFGVPQTCDEPCSGLWLFYSVAMRSSECSNAIRMLLYLSCLQVQASHAVTATVECFTFRLNAERRTYGHRCLRPILTRLLASY